MSQRLGKNCAGILPHVQLRIAQLSMPGVFSLTAPRLVDKDSPDSSYRVCARAPVDPAQKYKASTWKLTLKNEFGLSSANLSRKVQASHAPKRTDFCQGGS